MTEQEIRNVFQRAGKLLYCDKITVSVFIENETEITGRCIMWYRKEKQIDEHKRICERLRLYDMLRMGFDGAFDYVNLGEYLPTGYTDNYDVENIDFVLGK